RAQAIFRPFRQPQPPLPVIPIGFEQGGSGRFKRRCHRQIAPAAMMTGMDPASRFQRLPTWTATMFLVLCALLVIVPAHAAERAKVSAALNKSALQPDQPVVIAVVFEVAEGFHAQSH